MEEINHLKIETVGHVFSKFMCMQRNVFDSYMHFFSFACRDMGWGTLRVWLGKWVSAPAWSRSGPPRISLTI